MEQYTAFAAWYDRMMGTVAYEDWARYLDGLLQEAGAKTVAECACGTGNLTWRLIKAGYSVTALDISEDMLLTAREKLRKMGLSCPFVREDMRTLSLHRPVDAVVAACDGVNYLTEGAEEFFAAAYRALKPGGILFCLMFPATISCGIFCRDAPSEIRERIGDMCGKTPWNRTAPFWKWSLPAL